MIGLRYLGFGVVKADRKTGVVTVKNSINGSHWSLPLADVPDLSPCRVSGNVANVWRDASDALLLQWVMGGIK